MRYKLQYFYSILVFFGVLGCSYFMVSQDATTSIPFRSIEAPPLRAEASALNPGMSQLFEAERAMSKVKQNVSSQKEDSDRNLSESPEVLEEKQ